MRLPPTFDPLRGLVNVPPNVRAAIDLIIEFDREGRISSADTRTLLGGILKPRKADDLLSGYGAEPAWVRDASRAEPPHRSLTTELREGGHAHD